MDGDTGRPIAGKLVEYDLSIGIHLHVYPLTPIAINRIAGAAFDVYPDPDPNKYRQALPNAFVEGATYVDTENPAYIAELGATAANRRDFTTELLLGAAVTAPNMQEIITHYQHQLDTMALISRIHNPWGACLRFFLANTAEVTDLLLIAQEKAPLTDAEVREAIATFRMALPGDTLSATGGRTTPPGVESDDSHGVESENGGDESGAGE